MTPPTASPIGSELLDDPDADADVVRRMLEDIARANRWFGGAAAMRRGLATLIEAGDRGATLRLLDVGTGAGDLPRAAQRWAARRGITMATVGVERHPAAARLAARSGVPTMVACGSMLPFGSRDARRARGEGRPLRTRGPSPSIDIVLLSQLLHHFDDDTAVALLGEAHRVATRGVIVADLRPSPAASVAFRAAGRAMRFAAVTIADGLTSLTRGRDAGMLAALARRAGLVPVLVRDLPLARVLVACRSAA